MLTIRFSRIGKRKKPFYRVIVSEKQKDTHAHYLELLGHYNPQTKEAVLKADRILHWIRIGASTSNSVYNLLVREKVIVSDEKRKSVFITKKRAAKIKDEKEKSAPAEKTPEPAAESVQA